MKINKLKQVEVEAKILSLCLKVSDRFTASLNDAEGEELKSYDGYVPKFMPGNHYGDYVMLDIDIDTGVIVNWKKPSQQEIEEFINGGEQDE